MTRIPVSPPGRASASLTAANAAPDFFSLLDQQIRMVVNLAHAVGEIVQGKESVHSVRLLDLEQRREELRRRHQAAVHSLIKRAVSVDEIDGTMEALDRAAVRLLHTARGLHQFRRAPQEAAGRMMALIERASESLQDGYTRLANGSPAAEVDADKAIGSRNALRSYRVMAREAVFVATDPESLPAASSVEVHQIAGEHNSGLGELYGYLSDVAQELASAGGILKTWSQRLSAGRCTKGVEPLPEWSAWHFSVVEACAT